MVDVTATYSTASLCAFWNIKSEALKVLSTTGSAKVSTSSPILRSSLNARRIGPSVSGTNLSTRLGTVIATAALPPKSTAVLAAIVMKVLLSLEPKIISCLSGFRSSRPSWTTTVLLLELMTLLDEVSGKLGVSDVVL